MILTIPYTYEEEEGIIATWSLVEANAHFYSILGYLIGAGKFQVMIQVTDIM